MRIDELICYSQHKYQKQSSEVSCKKGVLRNFATFTGKHLCQSHFFSKVAGPGLRPATLLKKRLRHSCFPVNFVKFLRAPLFTEYFLWLLLKCIFSLQANSHNLGLPTSNILFLTMVGNRIFQCNSSFIIVMQEF